MRLTVINMLRIDCAKLNLTAREWAWLWNRAKQATARTQPDPRRFIKLAIDLDVRSCWALQAYAERGQTADLASALEISCGLSAALVAEARRIGRHGLAQAYATRAETGA